MARRALAGYLFRSYLLWSVAVAWRAIVGICLAPNGSLSGESEVELWTMSNISRHWLFEVGSNWRRHGSAEVDEAGKRRTKLHVWPAGSENREHVEQSDALALRGREQVAARCFRRSGEKWRDNETSSISCHSEVEIVEQDGPGPVKSGTCGARRI